MDLKPFALLLALTAGTFAGTPTPTAKPDSTGTLDAWADAGYGQLSGKVQSLLMHRNMDGIGQGTSGTLALTLDYLGPNWNGLSFGGQFVGSARLFESGDRILSSQAYWLANDRFAVLNEAYLTYNFSHLDWDNTHLKIGRQVVDYDFAPRYNSRQKDQAFEAAILQLVPTKGLRIDIGHLERFSSWASRSGGPSTWRANFIDVERRAGVSYGTSGFQFVSAIYDPCSTTSFSLYDFYGNDLYNTLGLKASHRWDLGENLGSIKLRGHYANQQDVGRMDIDGIGSIDSNIIEVAVDYTKGGLTLSSGAVLVDGDNFQTPFRSSFTIDTELLWYTRQFIGESNSGFIKAVYKTSSWLFYTMYVLTDHDDGSICQEIDGVVKYQFNDQLSTTVKAGYGWRDFSRKSLKSDTDALDLRWFMAWEF